MADAIAHCSERNVAFKLEDLEKFILSERLFTDVTALEPLIKEHQELIVLPGMERQYTTWTAVKRELATIELMQSGIGAVNPILHTQVASSLLEKTSLNLGQQQAVSLAATTTDQFIAWQGVAGAGKTFALKELNAIALAQGYTLKAFAPSSMAAKVLSQELGIQGETVASLLVSEPAPLLELNQIWIVDEAGLLSAKDAHALLERATLEGARLLLVGDTKQLSAVEAGNPFKSLQQAGIKTAHLNQSNRQRNPDLKIAVDLIADGRVEAGFKQLEAIGSIQEVSPDTKLEMIAAEYMAMSWEERGKTLILAGTNTEKLAITQAIRGKLKDEGSLGATANITQLQAKNLTLVQMRYTHNFELGDVVMPTRNYKRRGLEKGKLYEVVSKDIDRLTLKAPDGKCFQVDTIFEKAVYQRDEIEIAVGDRLQWKKNDRQLQRRNGQEFIVTAIEGDSAQIEYLDSKITETINLKEAQNLDYALVSTIYSSQGKTTDLALIAADYTIGQESFYVAISRARHNVKLYTKDKSELLELAQESKAKDNALELLMKQVKQTQKQSSKALLLQGTTVLSSPRVKEPVLKAQPPVTEKVSLPVGQPVSRPVPLVTTSLETVAKPTPKEKHRDDRKSPVFEKPVLKTAAPTEAFWIPQKSEEVPNFIEPKHWQEFENSAIHPDIAAKNFESLQFNYAGGEHEAWERLMVSEKLNRTNTGRLTEGLIRAYSHLDAGGWWCDAGVDARSFADLTPGDKPLSKRWGCYKPNTPRPKKDDDGQIIEGKFIKYEHPPKVELSIFLLHIPDEFAERIYSKHKVNPTQQERKSGFWYCVWKHNIPCAIAEGAKKAASLLSQGHAAIGLPGISAGYRSPKDEFGKKIGKSYLHEELAVFATQGRLFKFCFDYETKPETKLHIERDISVTGRLLQKAGARVKVVSLPGPDKGVDDFIVARGPLAYEKLSYEAATFRDWQQQNQKQRAATISPPLRLTGSERSLQNQPEVQTNDFNRQQPNTDTVANRENRGVVNQSLPVNGKNRAFVNQQLQTEREDSVLGVGPIREHERNERESLRLLKAISGYLELQEIEQLGADIARINQSLTDGWLRGQGAANLSRSTLRENSAIVDRTESYGHSEQRHSEQLLNLITDFIEKLVTESGLVQTLPELTEQISQYQQQLAETKTIFNQLDHLINQKQQLVSSQKTVDAITDFIEQSVIESALIERLPSLTKQLFQYQQQISVVRTKFHDLEAAIAYLEQRLLSQTTVDAIAENIEQSLVESTLTALLPQLVEQLSQYQQLAHKTAISDYVDQETVASYDTVSALSKLKELLGLSQSQTQTEFTTALQKVLELIEKLGHDQNHSQENVQPLSSRLTTNIEVETELSKESVKLHLKKMIQGLAREQLAEVVMEVGKYVKGEKVTEEKISELFASVTPVTLILTFEEKMNIVRQLIRDDKPSIMERLKINPQQSDDNGEQIRFRR